jgi:hypothetical protein
MAKMVIGEDVPQIAGEYEIVLPPWTKREWHMIKKETGIVAGEFGDPDAKMDMNQMTALALVALGRAGKGHLAPLLWETDDEQVTFDFSEEEAAEKAIPPPNEPNASESASSTSDQNERSGPSGANGGENPESPPNRIGLPVSATGAT